MDSLRASLERLGLTPDDIDHVVLSHCHWDHCGGLVEEARLGALFPRARVHAPTVEIERCLHPDPARGVLPGRRPPTAPRSWPAAGLRGQRGDPAGPRGPRPRGHSDGVSVIVLGEGSERAIFWADVVPTTHHIQPPYIMAYDLNAGLSYEVRREDREGCGEGWTGLFYHDPDVPIARIEADGRKFVATPVEPCGSSACPSLTEPCSTWASGRRSSASRATACIPPIGWGPSRAWRDETRLRADHRMAPDLVLVNSEENRLEDAEELEDAGLRLHASMPRTFEETAAMVRSIGQALDRATEGETIAASIEERAAAARIQASQAEPVTRYLIWKGPGWRPAWTPSPAACSNSQAVSTSSGTARSVSHLRDREPPRRSSACPPRERALPFRGPRGRGARRGPRPAP